VKGANYRAIDYEILSSLLVRPSSWIQIFLLDETELLNSNVIYYNRMLSAYLFKDDKWRSNKCQMFCFMQWLRFVWKSCKTEVWTNCVSNFEVKQSAQSEVWLQNKTEKTHRRTYA
jgi:hypothetical protein